MDKFIFMIITHPTWWEHYRLTLCHVWMLLSTPPCQTVLLVVSGRDKSKSWNNSIVLECIKCTITINFWLPSKLLSVRYLSVFYSFKFNFQLSMHFIVSLDFLFSREKCFHISPTLGHGSPSIYFQYLILSLFNHLIINTIFINNCVRGTRTQPLICVGYSVHYWMSCAINKGGFFEIAFSLSSSTHICLALRRLFKFCLTLTR